MPGRDVPAVITSEVEPMISNPASRIHPSSPPAHASHSPLPVETAGEAARDEPFSSVPATGVRSFPRLRRSIELEGAPAPGETRPAFESPAAGVTHATPEEVLEQRKEAAWNRHNTQNLVNALSEIQEACAKDPGLDIAAALETTKFPVHPLSTFGRAYRIAPNEQVPVAWFLRENQLYVPENLEQLANLIAVSKEPLIESPLYGNQWGLLSRPATLDPEQRTKLSEIAKTEMGRLFPGSGMFSVFHKTHGVLVQGKHATEKLERMIGSAEVQILGQKLEAAFKGAPTPTSAAEWAMAAMVLELDPQAGSQHGVVAGYDLYQPSNWGVSASVVVQRLVQHLVDGGKVPAEMAPAAARLLLAGAAPVFLVAGMPGNLLVGSAAFARLSAAVAAQEFWAPGSTAHTSFDALMRRADQSPISDAQAVVEARSQTQALIEWGVAQGRLSREDAEACTPAQVAALRDAFNEAFTTLQTARQQLSASLPTRKEMALEQLQKAYGAKGPFDVRNIRITNIDASESEYHSLLDIYMAGKMDRIPRGDRYDFRIGNRFLRVKPLPDINQAFNTQFDQYYRNLKEGVATVVKHQLSQLPREDRQTIASGKVEFFSLRKASVAQAEGEESEAEAQAAKARYGLLMRVESKIDKQGSDKDHKNLRYVYYEVFPLQGLIRRRDDLPRYLPNPAPRVADPETYAARQAKGVGFKVDYQAYERGTPLQPDAQSSGLLTERVRGLHLPESKQGQQANPAVHANPRFSTIADVVTDHLLHDREAMKAGAKGVTPVEEEEAGIKAGHDFVTGLIPFKNAIENAVKGNTGDAVRDFALDILGFAIPFGKGLGQAGKAARTLGEKVGMRAFKASDTLLRAAFSGLNPGDGLGDLTMGLVRRSRTLLQAGYRELNAVRGLNFNAAAFANPTGVVEGTLKTPGVVGDALKVSAKRHLGQWYAFDVNSARVYGPPLKHFQPVAPVRLNADAVDNAMFNRYAVSRARLAGVTPNSQGIYRGADNREYIRNVDNNGNVSDFQVREVSAAHGEVQARLIDPKTNRQTEFLLQRTGTDQWQRVGLKGGVSETSRPVVIELPMEEVNRAVTRDGSVQFMASDSHLMTFDAQLGAWRNAQGQVRWREGLYQWRSGTVEEYRKVKDTLPKSAVTETISFNIPRVPKGATPIVKEINYIWAGGVLPDQRASQIISNAHHSPGYKSIVHIDADTPEAFEQIKAKLQGKAPNLELVNLNEDSFFQAFKASNLGEVYQFFRQGTTQNLAAASDSLRYSLINKRGGIYLDSDDAIQANVGNVDLNAAPGEVLLNGHVTREDLGFTGYNNSNFASHADNPVLQQINDNVYKRFQENKTWLQSNRPYLPAQPTAQEVELFEAYENKIFDVTGPRQMNEVLEETMGDTYHLSWAATRPDIEGIKLADDVMVDLSRAVQHYTPFYARFPVEIGSDASMARGPV